jgi:polyisoprenoid-binding protein YceI
MTRTMIAAALGLALAFAGAAEAGDLKEAQGGTFALDNSHAKVVFAINHLGFSTYYGFFASLAGSLRLDPQAPANSAVTVDLDLAKSLVTDDPKLDEKLKSDAFFDVAKFPTASFKSTSIEMTGPNEGTLTGDLTLHGVTHPVTLRAKFNGAGAPPMVKLYIVGFSATGTIKRSDFGIKNFIPLVGDEVELTISAEFNRAQ